MVDNPLEAPSQRDRFVDYYALPRAPWDIGRPQDAFLAAAPRITGRVLDAGCGRGDLALWLASRGHAVTGIDFLEAPLVAARRKGAELGLAVNFLQMDALSIGAIPERFDAVTDCTAMFSTTEVRGMPISPSQLPGLAKSSRNPGFALLVAFGS